MKKILLLTLSVCMIADEIKIGELSTSDSEIDPQVHDPDQINFEDIDTGINLVL